MAAYRIFPEEEFTPKDIEDTLNEYGGNTDESDWSTFFSSEANINMWSKFKPIVANFYAGKLWENGAYQTNGCGITIPFYDSPSRIREVLINGEGEWFYTPPAEVNNAPLRIGDFRRYFPEAVNPIGDFADTYIANRVSGTDSVSILIELVVDENDSNNLTMRDLNVAGIESDFKDMYLGAFLVKPTGSYYFRTSTTPIGEEKAFAINIPLNYGEGGIFEAYLFLSTSVQDGGENDGFFTTLDKKGKSITIKSAGSTYQLNASGYVAAGGLKEFQYNVWLHNNNSTEVAFINVSVQVQHYIDKSWQNEGTPKMVSTSKVVAGGESVALSGVLEHNYIFNSEDLKNGLYRIFACSESPEITSEAGAFDEPQPEEYNEKDTF